MKQEAKKINASKLIKRVESQKKLTREEKLRRIIDIAYKKLYQVKKESWKTESKKTNLLIKQAEKKMERMEELRIKEAAKNFVSNYKL